MEGLDARLAVDAESAACLGVQPGLGEGPSFGGWDVSHAFAHHDERPPVLANKEVGPSSLDASE